MNSLLPDFFFHKHDGRTMGVAVGLVTNNQDPDGMGRVKVKFPWLGENDESHWARVLSPMAGNDRGAYFLPEVDDEVLVAFEHGSMDHAYVLGSLWNGKDKPPEANSDGKNNRRVIKSRSGHVVRLDDSDGSEKIEIVDKTGQNRIVIGSSDNSMTIEAAGDISLEAAGDISLEAKGKITLSGKGIELQSQMGITVNGSLNVDVTASAQLNLKGTLVNLN